MQQRRGKNDDGRQGIPRDAKGVPIFLILPTGVRKKYEQLLKACEDAWREGEPLALAEAMTWVTLHRQPNPMWLEQAVIELAVGKRTKKQAKRYAEAQKKLTRYQTVRDLRVGIPGLYGPAGKMSWEEAREKAAELLAESPAAGSDSTMKDSYDEVKQHLKHGHFGRYFMLKDWRYRQNGKPDPKGRTLQSKQSPGQSASEAGTPRTTRK
jgi:hypothetical protein